MSRLCMDYVCNMRGICMECVWNTYIMHVECGMIFVEYASNTYGCVWNVYGIYEIMEPVLNMHGICRYICIYLYMYRRILNIYIYIYI